MDKHTRIPPSLLLDPGHLLSLGFGSGLFPKAPGTMGTVAAIPVYYVSQLWGWGVYAAFLLAFLVMGVGLCDRTAKALAVHDHPGIVWDEVVGFMIAMIFIPPEPLMIFAGFVLFRLFDIWKPWPIDQLDEKVAGGFGIMLDDVLAGIYAAICMQLLLFSGLIGP